MISNIQGECPMTETNTRGEDAPRTMQQVLANVTSAGCAEWRRCRRWPFAEGRRSPPGLLPFRRQKTHATTLTFQPRHEALQDSVDTLLRANMRTL